MSPILLIVGTRPEGIKMLPVYYALKKAHLPVVLVSTGQHTTLLQEVFNVFGVQPDIDLALGKPHQDLAYLTQAVISACTDLYKKFPPSLVLVQGDTTTVMAAALAAFYLRIPIGHVEAGLRTNDITQPFPEEMNRRFLGTIASYHFAPTSVAMGNLLAENINREMVFCTGNTVVDALLMMKEKIEHEFIAIRSDLRSIVEQQKQHGKKIVVLTTHRRESFEGGIARILTTVKELAQQHQNLFFIYPYHPNPHVVRALDESNARTLTNMFITEPVAYTDLVYLLLSADFVMTDSGGIQEEAISLGKPTLVLREKTERIEGIWHGIAQLVGTDPQKIVAAVENILAYPKRYETNTLYGDGYAAQKIVQIITMILDKNARNISNERKNQRSVEH